MIGVTGASGELGGRVAARLAKMGVRQRLIVRNPDKTPRLPGAEVAVAPAYGDAAAMGRALHGVETLFLVSAHDKFGVDQNAIMHGKAPPAYDRLREQCTAADAAAAIGVRRIVYLSFMSAAPDATFILSHDHYYTEEHIRHIGVDFTFLRMSLYTDHVPVIISDDGVIRGPGGEGRAAWVTRDDIAEVAAIVLTQGGEHDGETYDVTGPEALSLTEAAEKLSFATGRKITYQMQTPHEARLTRTTSGMDKFEAERRAKNGTGLSDYDVEVFVTHFMQIATGELSAVSDTVPRLTGHKAQSLSEYLQKHPESYQHLLAHK
ncbi:MAG: SDR family oxidoreductase [Dehalococcoidales bacterium]